MNHFVFVEASLFQIPSLFNVLCSVLFRTHLFLSCFLQKHIASRCSGSSFCILCHNSFLWFPLDCCWTVLMVDWLHVDECSWNPQTWLSSIHIIPSETLVIRNSWQLKSAWRPSVECFHGVLHLTWATECFLPMQFLGSRAWVLTMVQQSASLPLAPLHANLNGRGDKNAATVGITVTRDAFVAASRGGWAVGGNVGIVCCNRLHDNASRR